MDKGPFRAQRSAERPVARPEPAVPAVAPTAQPEESPSPRVGRAHTPAAQSAHTKKRWPWAAAIIVILIAVGVVVYFLMSNPSSGIESGKYQAVSTTDGQVYFGKMSVMGNGYVRITGAYYLQTQADTSTTNGPASQTSSDKNSVKLVKLSNKIYGPESEIFIARDQILSYENLSPGGQVAKWLQRNN